MALLQTYAPPARHFVYDIESADSIRLDATGGLRDEPSRAASGGRRQRLHNEFPLYRYRWTTFASRAFLLDLVVRFGSVMEG
jgi:hypothetical protein